MIFDCCYAGNLDTNFEGRGHWAERSFELLAACKHDAKTHPPGKKSFTKALIWALESLLKSRRIFSTHELQMKIPHAPGFPKEQVVRIIDRGEPSDHRLVLAATPLRSDSMMSDAVPSKPPIIRPKLFIDLRFWYTEIPDEYEIELLSTRLKQLIVNQHIKAHRIGWTRMGNVDQVRNVLDKWKRLRRLTIPPSPVQSYLQPAYTPPPSHSGNSSISDAHIDTEDIFPISVDVPETTRSPKVQMDRVSLNTSDPENLSVGRSVSMDLGPRPKSLAGGITSMIGVANLITIVNLSLFCYFICSYVYNYVFDRK